MKKMRLKNEKIVRVQFELNEQGIKELEKLMEATSVATRKDLFNNALTLLEWAVKERQKGRVIASVDETEEKYKEIEMPVLSNAVKNRNKINLVVA